MGIKRLPDSPSFLPTEKEFYQFQYHISIWTQRVDADVLCMRMRVYVRPLTREPEKKSFSLKS